MTRARRAVALLLTLAVAAGAVAQEPAAGDMDAGALLGEAADLYRQADQLESAGQSAAAAEALRGALLRYERVGSSTGWSNGRLAYNAANTHLRLGDMGRAVLMYRRAAELIPGDRNVRQGLGYAPRAAGGSDRRAGVGRVDARGAVLALPAAHEDARDRLPGAVGRRVGGRPAAHAGSRRAAPALAAAGRRRLRAAGLRVWQASLAAELVQASTPRGVITAASVVARQGDGHSYEPSFGSALHGGTEFRLLEDRGEWWHIRLADGRETWIVAGAGELIR